MSTLFLERWRSSICRRHSQEIAILGSVIVTTAISSREKLKRDLEKEPLKGINMAKNVMKNIESNLKMTAASIEKKAGYEGEARRRAVAHGSKISKNGNL